MKLLGFLFVRLISFFCSISVYPIFTASWTLTMKNALKISGGSDDDAAAFYSSFAPNDFTANVAAASEKYGFYFYNNKEVLNEVSSNTYITCLQHMHL